MSSPLYFGKFLEKQGAVVRLQLSIIHPDVVEFGTERCFAWKVLSDWVSPEDDLDDAAMARKYIKRVEVSPLQNGTVDEEHPGFFSVKRKGKKDPTVVYTIEVSDEAILDGVSVGDSDEVHQYVEPDKVILDDVTATGGSAGTRRVPASAPRATKPAAKGKKSKEPAPPSPKTFDDFRSATLTLVARNCSWADYLIDLIVGWAEEASDEQLMVWIDRLPPEGGWLCRAAARLAVQRALDGKTDSARAFLEAAESARPAADEDAASPAAEGLIPAWWRLGKQAEADESFAKLRAEMVANGCRGTQLTHTLAGMAALGGRTDILTTIMPEVLEEKYCEEKLLPGMMALYRDGERRVFEEVLRRWNDVDECGDPVLSRRLLRLSIRLGKPGDYLDLAARYPRALEQGRCAEVALRELERRSPADAVRAAQHILATESFYEETRMRAVAILATHAPEAAEAWARDCALLSDSKKEFRFAYLAALSRNEEAREGVALLEKSTSRYAIGSLSSLARFTTDRALAALALRAYAGHHFCEFESCGETLVRLVELGERAFVDACLTGWLAEIEKLVPKERDLRCRAFAANAGMVGRLDLALEAISLPTKSTRRYSAKDCVRGCAQVGDWTSAMVALELDPDDGSNGRVSTALQSGLHTASQAFVDGPYGLPLRCLS